MALNSRHLVLILSAVPLLAACIPPSGKESPAISDAKPVRQAVAAPDAEALLAQESLAAEAFIKGDSAYFDGILSDKMVMQTGGSRLGKSDVIKMIAGVRCQVEDGWSLTEPQMSKIDDDTYALIYKSSMNGHCTGSGKTEELPDPVRAASVWIRSGEQWKTVFHGEIPIFDPAASPANEKKDDSEGKDTMTAPAPPPSAPVKATSDPISDELMGAERVLWDAWMKHDADKINKLTTSEMAFVNLFGATFPDKAAAVADWTSDACEVTSFMLSNGVGTSISPTVGILTVTGTVKGTCAGQDISGQKIHVTTVYVKNGDDWKWAFGFNSPK